jgi:hypothetical protein
MRKILGLSLIFCLSLGVKGQPLPAQVKQAGAIFRVPDSATLDVALTADGKLLARGGVCVIKIIDAKFADFDQLI